MNNELPDVINRVKFIDKKGVVKSVENLIDVYDKIRNEVISISTRLLSNSDVCTFKTIDTKKLKEIHDKLSNLDEFTPAFGKRSTAFTLLNMSLDMISTTPARKLRQIFATLENRRQALRDNIFKIQETLIDIDELKEQINKSDNPIDKRKLNLKLFKLLSEAADGLVYIEAAIKEIGILIKAYDALIKKYNIPENWDEVWLEKREIEEHIKHVFRLSLRDIRLSGRISIGTQEYIEQIGLSPTTVQHLCQQFYEKELRLIKEGKAPTLKLTEEFLEEMYQMFKDVVENRVQDSIGITFDQYKEYLYQHKGGK